MSPETTVSKIKNSVEKPNSGSYRRFKRTVVCICGVLLMATAISYMYVMFDGSSFHFTMRTHDYHNPAHPGNQLSCMYEMLHYMQPDKGSRASMLRIKASCNDVNITDILVKLHTAHSKLSFLRVNAQSLNQLPDNEVKISGPINCCGSELPTCKLYRDFSSESTSFRDNFKFMETITKCGGVKPVPLNPNVQNHTMKNISLDYDQGYKVPNIVHYVWFSKHTFTYLNYLSFLSVEKFLKPWSIFIHGDTTPNGTWWERTKKDVKNIYFVKKKRRPSIHGKKFHYIQHSADIARMEIMLDYGGIYLDTDVLILKSFDPLRKYPMTMGQETSYSLASGIILAQRGYPFIRMWYETYHTFSTSEWGEHSVKMPFKLSKLFPHMIHIEKDSMFRPNWAEDSLLFKQHYNWSKNYALHVWKRHGYVPENPEKSKKYDCTLGEVMRYVYFGRKDLIKT